MSTQDGRRRGRRRGRRHWRRRGRRRLRRGRRGGREWRGRSRGGTTSSLLLTATPRRRLTGSRKIPSATAPRVGAGGRRGSAGPCRGSSAGCGRPGTPRRRRGVRSRGQGRLARHAAAAEPGGSSFGVAGRRLGRTGPWTVPADRSRPRPAAAAPCLAGWGLSASCYRYWRRPWPLGLGRPGLPAAGPRPASRCPYGRT